MVRNRNMADTANSMAFCATKHGLLDRNEGRGQSAFFSFGVFQGSLLYDPT